MTKRAWLNLRYVTGTRADFFKRGLKRLGYKVLPGIPYGFTAADLFVTWNRVGAADRAAREVLAAGGRVLVAENSTWGNDFAGRRWLHIAPRLHNTAGLVTYCGPERFDALGVALSPFRSGGETIILPQRGIGSPPVAMPREWPLMARKKYQARTRKHPGKFPAIPLEEDLKDCGRVVTWGSGAAIKALALGIEVISDMPNWIGEQDNTEDGRLAMFRRLAWAQHRHDEIRSGEAFERLLCE